MSFPRYELDLFDQAGIEHPYPHYARIRDLGPVVQLAQSDVLAVGRYADVKSTLLRHKDFICGEGVAVSEQVNEIARGATLTSDPPLHQTLRGIIGAPLSPTAVAGLREQIQRAADELIERLVKQGSFDGVRDLARFLPVSIVSNLVGLPEAGRERMLDWAAAGFDSLGPFNGRAIAAMPMLQEMFHYVANEAGPGQVQPGSWAARIYDAADRGLIAREQAPILLFDYLGPSLDTTISATAHLLNLLSRHAGQWQALREDQSLIPGAIDETIRLESPIRGFTRRAANACSIDGVQIPAGARLLMLYASANRDERKWADPEVFDIRRPNVSDQIGFGIGRHVCAGQHLARLEIGCLLRAMTLRMTRFEAGEPVVALNNILRCYASLPITVH